MDDDRKIPVLDEKATELLKMKTPDDRLAFEEHKQAMCLALAQDNTAFKLSMDTIAALDRYDYSYLWSFMGLPIIQMPADVLATLEVIWAQKPDVIIETGIARGGSVVMMAAMLQLIGKGKVIGVDIDIRSHNKDAIESHLMSSRIELIEGPSTAGETVARISQAIPAGSSVMVVLDSDHSRDHVLDELRTYSPFVTQDQFLVVADTLLGFVKPEQTPTKRSKVWLPGDEPLAAVNMFLRETDRFTPDDVINGKLVMSSSPGGYLRCTRSVQSKSSAPIPSVTLRAPAPADFPILAEMRRDLDLQEMLLVVPDLTDDEAVAEWIHRRSNETGGLFKVVVENDGAALGFVQISQVHRRNRTGFAGIALLPHARGRGIGAAAIKQMLTDAVRHLGLEKVLLEVRSDNANALKTYSRLGFRNVGVMRNHFRSSSGEMHDVLLLERSASVSD